MKKILTSTKKFVRRHQTGIVWGGIAIAVITIQSKNLKAMTEFIEEKDLWNEFRPEDANF